MFTEEKKRLCQKVDALEAEMTRLSLALHARPELGNEEYEAMRLLTDASRMQGFHVTQGAAGLPTAFVAKRGDSGPKIAFLAEYDALPGLGHACGHNLIASMSFGAAAAFAALTTSQAQTYFIGCPAEETQGGKIALTNAGVFNGFDAIFIVHPSDETTLGGTSLASHPLCVRFHGREAHVASRNERGINALLEHEARSDLRERRRLAHARRADECDDAAAVLVQPDAIRKCHMCLEIVREDGVRLLCEAVPQRLTGRGSTREILEDGLVDLLLLERILQRAHARRLLLGHDLREQALHLRELSLELLYLFRVCHLRLAACLLCL